MMYLDMGIESGYRRGILSVKVDGRYLVEATQRLFHASSENLPDGHLVLKLNLGLGGMDIDVD